LFDSFTDVLVGQLVLKKLLFKGSRIVLNIVVVYETSFKWFLD
jgi:hypothetical protein